MPSPIIPDHANPHGVTRDTILKNVDREGRVRRPWIDLAKELGVTPHYIHRRVSDMRAKGQLPRKPGDRMKEIVAAQEAEIRKATIPAGQSPKTMLEIIENTKILTLEQTQKVLSHVALNGDNKEATSAAEKLERSLSGADRGAAPPPETILDKQLTRAAEALSTLPPETFPEVIRRAEALRENPLATFDGTAPAQAASAGEATLDGRAGDA